MKRNRLLLALVASLFLIFTYVDQFDGVVLAFQQEPTGVEDTGYKITRWTVDGGGGAMQNGGSGYALHFTIGQHDAKVWQGGGYTLKGGFWGGLLAQYKVYLPLVLR